VCSDVRSAPAGAVTLRLCTDEQSHLPFITPGGEGVADLLIREAAAEAGIVVESHAAPITRCREEIRRLLADGFPTTPFTPSLTGFVAYPMNGAVVDPGRAVTSQRGMVYRRRGSAADWDGARFSGTSAPVLAPFGSVLLIDRLKAIGMPVEDSGKTLGANLRKLLAGRADLAVGAEFSGYALLSQPEFAGKLEMLTLPFTEEPYYLGLSRDFQLAHPQEVEHLWSAIARIRRTPAYQATLRRAMAEAALTLKE
jgi:polar amino acid transport system substrate-binding protein